MSAPGPFGARITITVDQLVNLTPHPIDLITSTGAVLTIPVQDAAPRVSIERTDVGACSTSVGSVPIVRSSSSGAPELPEPSAGRYLIVSRLVAEARTDRLDLLFPDDLVRDEGGSVLGCQRLGTLA